MNFRDIVIRFLLLVGVFGGLVSCQQKQEPDSSSTIESVSTATFEPTPTAFNTKTPQPIEVPSETPRPSPTATITQTLTPTEVPTKTPIPPPTLEPYLQHYERAKTMLDEDSPDYAGVIAELDKSIALNAQFVDAYVSRASAQSNLEEFDKARLDLEKALELDPEHAKAYDVLGTNHLRQGENDLAKDAYDQAIALDQEADRTYYHRGFLNVELGEYEDALADLDKSIELNPNSSDVFRTRALAKMDLGLWEDALVDIDQAIALKDDDTNYHYNRALILRNLGESEEAIAAYGRVIELDPDFAWAYHNRGNLHRDLGDLDKALADYDQALSLDPDDGLGCTNRALVHVALHNWEAALADYNQAIEIDSNDVWSYQKRGEVLLYSGHPEQAYDDFSQVMNMAPSDLLSFTTRALSLAAMDRYDEALADLNHVNAEAPDDPYADYFYGAVYLLMGDTDRALSIFDQVLDQVEITAGFGNASTGSMNTIVTTSDPQTAALSRFGRGRAYMALDQVEDTRADFSQAIQHGVDWVSPEIELLLNNGREEGYLYLVRGLIKAGNGEREASIDDYQMASDVGVDPALHSYFLHERSQIASSDGDLDSAILDLEQALTMAPDNTDAYFYLGLAYGQIEDYESGIDTLVARLELSPPADDLLGFADGLTTVAGMLAQNITDQQQMESVVEAYQLVITEVPDYEISGPHWNNLCWYGSIWGLAEDVQYACDLAVEIDPVNGGKRDSRGIGRALIGDFAGAVEDFQYFIAWGAENNVPSAELELREEWIAALEAGRNPLDEAMLEKLRTE